MEEHKIHTFYVAALTDILQGIELKEIESVMFDFEEEEDIKDIEVLDAEEIKVDKLQDYSEEDEKRMDIIAQNGNDGEHYEKDWEVVGEEEVRPSARSGGSIYLRVLRTGTTFRGFPDDPPYRPLQRGGPAHESCAGFDLRSRARAPGHAFHPPPRRPR